MVLVGYAHFIWILAQTWWLQDFLSLCGDTSMYIDNYGYVIVVVLY